MFKKIKESIVVALSVLLFAVPVLAPISVHAAQCTVPPDPADLTCTPAPAAPTSSTDIRRNLCNGVNLSATDDPNACQTIDSPTDGTASANTLIKNIINIFSLVVGIVAVVMIIIAGFRYITSGGNDGNVGTAKNTILYAVIGLVIVALAQVIVKFVLTKTKI